MKEHKLRERELAEAEEQHRQLHRIAYKMVRDAVHDVVVNLHNQGHEVDEVWCAVESACLSVSAEADIKMHVAQWRAEGAPKGFVKIIEDVVNFGVEINSGQYDEPLAAAQLTDESASADVDEDSEEEDDEGRESLERNI